MSNRNLTLLGIAAVVMVLLAAVTTKMANRVRTQPEGTSYLIQGLNPDQITRITFTSGEQSFTLQRTGRGFIIDEKDGYPAKTAEVNKLITSCLDIKTGELYTSNPDNFEELGVAEESGETVVKFFKGQDELLTGVIMGKTREQDRGRYVRRPGADQVFVAYDAPYIRSDVTGYMETSLVSAKEDQMQSATVKGPDGSYTLVKNESDVIVPKSGVPEGMKMKAYEARSVFNVLSGMRMDDVMLAGRKPDLAFDRQYVGRLKDSTVYTVDIAQADDKTYVKLSAEFTDKTPVTKERGVESEEALKEKEAKLLAMDAVDDFNARHKGWIYTVPSWQKDNLTKALSELYEAEEKDEEPAADEAAPAMESESAAPDEPNAAAPAVE